MNHTRLIAAVLTAQMLLTSVSCPKKTFATISPLFTKGYSQ